MDEGQQQEQRGNESERESVMEEVDSFTYLGGASNEVGGTLDIKKRTYSTGLCKIQ